MSPNGSHRVNSILSEPMFAKCPLEAQNVAVITYSFDAVPGNTHEEFSFLIGLLSQTCILRGGIINFDSV